MSSFSVLCLGFTAAFAPDRLFRRNGGVNACIIKIRVVIPPAVVILPCNFPRFQFGGLLLPGTEALLKICCFGAAVKYVGTKADQPIGILNADQFPIFQRKQCVHQSIYPNRRMRCVPAGLRHHRR